MKLKEALVTETLGLEHLPQCRSVRTFDDQYTAPLHGFSSADAYYQQSSSRQFLSQIHCPTLILSALNDPF